MQLHRGMCTLHALNCKQKGGLISIRFVSRNSIFIGFVTFRLISFPFIECDMSTERSMSMAPNEREPNICIQMPCYTLMLAESFCFHFFFRKLSEPFEPSELFY